MRRTGFALLALLAAFALSGCGGGEESPGQGDDEPTTTKQRGYGY